MRDAEFGAAVGAGLVLLKKRIAALESRPAPEAAKVSLRVAGDAIEWNDGGEWQPLIALEEIKGPQGEVGEVVEKPRMNISGGGASTGFTDYKARFDFGSEGGASIEVA